MIESFKMLAIHLGSIQLISATIKVLAKNQVSLNSIPRRMIHSPCRRKEIEFDQMVDVRPNRQKRKYPDRLHSNSICLLYYYQAIEVWRLRLIFNHMALTWK
jgi:hypothetical protein